MTLRLSFILLYVIAFSVGCSGKKEILGENPTYSESLQRNYFKGTNYKLKGDLDEAYASFLRCSDEEPDEPSFHYDLARIDHDLSRLESAKVHYDVAVEFDPENDWLHYHRGLNNIKLEDYDEAWNDFAFWVMYRPTDIEALNTVEDLFYNNGQPWHAFKMLEFYEETIAHNVDVRIHQLAILPEITFELEDIEKFLNKAIEDFPNEPIFTHHLGMFASILGDDELAIMILERLMREHPEYTTGLISLADSYYLEGDIDKALKALSTVFSSQEILLAEKIDILSRYQVASIKSPEALDTFEYLLNLALENHPDEPDLLQFASVHWFNHGMLEKARDALEVVVKQAPGSLESIYNFMGVLTELNDFEKIVEVGENSLLTFPLEPLLYLFTGEAYKELGKFNEAINFCKDGLAVVIDSPTMASALHNEIAFSHRQLNEKEASYDEYESSLRLNPDPFIMNNHAYYLATDNKRLQDALKWSTLANEERPDEPSFMDTHALVLHLLSRNSDALEWIVLANDLIAQSGDSPDPVFQEREGDIRWSLGDVEGAFKLWNQALIAGGGAKRLNEKLSRTP